MHRFGPWRRAARRVTALTVICTGAATRLAAAPSADARVVARAGIDVFSAHASAAAPVSRGWVAQLGTARAYVGSGLVDAFVHVRRSGRRAGLALGWEQRTSPVHRTHATHAVLQVRTQRIRAGLGVHLRRRQFEGYAARLSWEPHVGFSLRRAHQVVALRARRTRATLRLDLGLRLRVHRNATLELQHGREPGRAARTRGALTLRGASLVAHAAYDVATGSAASGFEAGSRTLRVVYGVRTHPELGWSHAWMLEFGARLRR